MALRSFRQGYERFLEWICIALMIALAEHVDDVTPTEQSIFEFFNTLPDGLQSLFVTLYRLGALWAVGLVVAAALLDRRWRLARDLAISGGLAWAIARILGALVVEKDSLGGSLDVVTRFGDTPSFPLVRLAVVVAVVAAAAPYVSRPTRRVGGVPSRRPAPSSPSRAIACCWRSARDRSSTGSSRPATRGSWRRRTGG